MILRVLQLLRASAKPRVFVTPEGDLLPTHVRASIAADYGVFAIGLNLVSPHFLFEWTHDLKRVIQSHLCEYARIRESLQTGSLRTGLAADAKWFWATYAVCRYGNISRRVNLCESCAKKIREVARENARGQNDRAQVTLK